MSSSGAVGPVESVASPADPPPRAERGRFKHVYGAQPWHLVALLACFAVTAYAVSRLLDDLPVLLKITIWFVGSAVVWDLVLGPLLAGADSVLRRAAGRLRVSPVNYVRFPALLSLLLLVMFTPLIFQRSESIYRLKAGLTQDPYLDRWLAITGVLFALSALAYAVDVLRTRRR